MRVNHAARGFLRQNDGQGFFAVDFDGQGEIGTLCFYDKKG
jgi:hypothetical protein